MSGTDSGINLPVMILGAVIIVLALTFQIPSLSSRYRVNPSVLSTLLFTIYGVSMFAGGFLQGETEYTKYMVDISASACGIIMALGPLTGLIDQSLWIKLTGVSLIFLSVPSTLATWYLRDRNFESDRYWES